MSSRHPRTRAQESESTANPLEVFAWMVGDWVDQDEDATIESSVNWTKNRKVPHALVPRHPQRTRSLIPACS